jgi:acyl-CoA dehydrogenase
MSASSGAGLSEALHDLPAQYRDLQAEAASLAQAVAGAADRADESSAVDPEMREQLAKSGLTALLVPAAYGGRSEVVDPVAATVVREVLAGTSSHLDSLFAMQGIGSLALGRAGDEELRRRWLPRIATLDAIAALALTEPGVGSDLKAITTTVREDNGSLIVDGHKSFITNAGYADTYTVLGREGDGFSLVLVPADSEGLSTSSPHQIIAPHVLGDVVMDGVRVPAAHRIGPPGGGFPLVLATLATFRVSVAGAALGVAQSALDDAVRYTTGHSAFGAPLHRLGSIPQQLALSWTEIEMARAFTYTAAAAAAQDPGASLHWSSMAKVGATEVAGRVVDRAVQVMGRAGLTRGTVIERMYRAARPMRIYEGGTEALLDALARRLVATQQ